MTFTSVLKATERSLKLVAIRAGVRIGALVAPSRTAALIARRFFCDGEAAVAANALHAQRARAR